MSTQAKNPISPKEIIPADRSVAVLTLLMDVENYKGNQTGLLKLILDHLKSNFDYAEASIYLLDHEVKSYELFFGQEAPTSEFHAKLPPKSPVAQCHQNRNPVINQKGSFVHDNPREKLLRKNRVSLCLPLFSLSNTHGVLEVFSEMDDFFSTSEVEFLEKLCLLISSILSSAELYENNLQYSERIQRVFSITDDINLQPGADNIIRRTVVTLSVMFPDSRIAFLCPETGGTLRVRSYTGYSDTDGNTLRLRPGGIIEKASINFQPQRITDIQKQKSGEGLSPDSRSVLVVPVHFEGSLLGVINLENTKVDAFSEDDFKIVNILSNHIAPYISTQARQDQNGLQGDFRQQLYEASEKIRKSSDIETIMRVAAEAISNTLKIPKATILVDWKALLKKPSSDNKESL